ncbi:type VI secretion system protein VasG [Enterobacter hormaechei]|nr:type VI secretion ATPase%2C ClpV1 family [Enterobacter hormaechei]SAA68324.1 type VI secretion ATPase%2C ClpV1 family [Enterobacter hormaechei]SAB55757.1 type VI secretion ATPase%2C ClpV1 family [Enterobacter hormaechei]SAB93664.1 type VI secretion ATPase%2C ClpV1 family [Enterobacter hormaechei]VAG54947.1 type VI secretion system protein VasG [Enterobacter hormaechei]
MRFWMTPRFLTLRRVNARQLPDKAVDLLDTASARIRMSLDTVPEPLTRMKAQLTALAMEKQALLEDIAVGNTTHGERLVAIEQDESRIILQLDEREIQYGQELALTEQLLACRADISRQAEMADLQQQLSDIQKHTPLLGLDVDARTVATVIADWTGVPLSSLMKDEQTELLSLEHSLAKRVVGQDSALNAIAQRLRASKTGLAPENGPQGVFLLVGPSGTGKTETALALADELFGGEKSLITINLSEYQEPHTVSQLKGSPPGYVGYGQGGILTEAVRKRPYSVVLLDEVEKAHRDVMNLFYQVFDRGVMRDGEGREIDFRNTVILMTSNLGSDLIMQMLEEQPEATEPDLHELLRPVLRDHFQPALLARFQTVIYRPLAKAAMRTIVEMKLAQVSKRLNRHYGMKTGFESLWVRQSRPYAGNTYGLHLPLLAGTEVAIGFEDGNPDRPYIAGVLHDSAHGDHVTIRNYRRNVLRTPANNKIRLDDERGKEHIKVSTEYGGKSQLNLGHLVDSEKQQRGEGFELRTDSWGAIRAQKGLFISADGQAKAKGLQREMQAALKELDAAREVTSGLRHAAQAAQAELADLEKQTTLMNQTLSDLKQQALLLSAPSGIAQVTPASIQVSAGENLIVTAGQNADISIAKKLTLAVGDILSLFAHKLGIKMYASEGKVDIQAQSDALNLFAKEKLSVASSDNSVVISAKKEILLVCGGAFIRLSDAGVEVGTGKNVTLKCIAVQQQSAATLNSTLSLPSGCKPGVISAAQQQGAVVMLS